MNLKKLWQIIEEAKHDYRDIGKMQYSPQGDAIIVDMSFGKALRICMRGNEVHIQGDSTAGATMKNIIEGALKKCQ